MQLEADMIRNLSDVEPHSFRGRRVIFTNEEEITRENVVDVLEKALAVHQHNRAEIIYLQNYLRGVQPILNRYCISIQQMIPHCPFGVSMHTEKAPGGLPDRSIAGAFRR